MLIYIWVEVGLGFAFASDLLFTTHHLIAREDPEYRLTSAHISDKTDPSTLLHALELVGVFTPLDVAVLQVREVSLFRLSLQVSLPPAYTKIFTVKGVQSQTISVQSGRHYPSDRPFMLQSLRKASLEALCSIAEAECWGCLKEFWDGRSSVHYLRRSGPGTELHSTGLDIQRLGHQIGDFRKAIKDTSWCGTFSCEKHHVGGRPGRARTNRCQPAQRTPEPTLSEEGCGRECG